MHSDIVSGAVIVNNQHILAFYVLQSGSRLIQEDIRKHLASALPNYMLPDFYQELEALPLTPAGKVDRKKLAQIEIKVTSNAAFEPLATPMERTIAQLWEQALGIKDFGRQDGFFELGGHSLQLIQIIAELKKKVNIEAHLADFFGVRTI
jgi:acyl carrier protein